MSYHRRNQWRHYFCISFLYFFSFISFRITILFLLVVTRGLKSSGELNSQYRGSGNEGVMNTGLLDLTGWRGGRLAAHARRVDWFRRNQIEIFIIWDFVQAIAVFQELDVQVLIDLLKRKQEEDRWFKKKKHIMSICFILQIPKLKE